MSKDDPGWPGTKTSYWAVCATCGDSWETPRHDRTEDAELDASNHLVSRPAHEVSVKTKFVEGS